jgi:hypothetical protein
MDQLGNEVGSHSKKTVDYGLKPIIYTSVLTVTLCVVNHFGLLKCLAPTVDGRVIRMKFFLWMNTHRP